jgi:hypothetical protein
MQHGALEQVRHGREADVRMGPHVVVIARPRGDGSEMIEENERTDALPRSGREHAPHEETAAQIVSARMQELLDRHGPSPK